jgi:alkaline phosphatase D
VATALLTLAVLVGCGVRMRGFQRPPSGITHGVAAGDVSATHANLWARCGGPGTLRVVVQASHGVGERRFETSVAAETDLAATIRADGLLPGTHYTYRAWCDDAENLAVHGRFRTAPPADVATAVRLAWGGDVGGQNVCRDTRDGYAIFDVVTSREPDVFVALGDMIYADDLCRDRGRYGNFQIPGPAGRAATLPGFWAYWQYNRADAGQQRLLASTAVVPVWDDHEIANDAGPDDDTPAWLVAAGHSDVHLLPLARAAFRHWNPVGDGPLHRRLRWGRHLDLFVLDTRSHRDAKAAPDDPHSPKTMLGAVQRTWLERGLRDSDATWKVVVSSVPMAIPTGDPRTGRDGWASGDTAGGYEHELLAILEAVRRARVRNVVWITTDVHHATAFRHEPFADPDFQIHEFVTGPLHAGVIPGGALDPTLRPAQLVYHAPPSVRLGSIDEARKWFNFGLLEVHGDGTLRVEIVDGYGATRWSTVLEPSRPSPGPGMCLSPGAPGRTPRSAASCPPRRRDRTRPPSAPRRRGSSSPRADGGS